MQKQKKSITQKLKNIVGMGKKGNIYESFPESYYFSYLYNTPGKAIWMPREYKKFADEAYIKNVIAHRSIAMVAQGAASVPFKLNYIGTDGSRQELKNHPALRLLSKPNPCDSGKEFIEAVYSYRLISGNAFIQMVKNGDGIPSELYALRPDRMSVIAGKDGLPSSYQYQVGETVQKFPVDRLTCRSNILHIKNFHPLNDWYGLSQIEPAAFAIDQHNQASVWNQSLLQNGARPTGALVVKTGADGSAGVLTEDQYTRIKHQMDDQFSGAANAGRPLLLEGGLDWREMSMSPKDMDFLNSKHSSARDVALAFGVPPQMLGIPGDNTYSNLVEARQALWEQTILPLVDNVANSLNHWLAVDFDKNLELTYNADEVPALAPKREARWKQINETSFMTVNEKRAAMGLPELDGGEFVV